VTEEGGGGGTVEATEGEPAAAAKPVVTGGVRQPCILIFDSLAGISKDRTGYMQTLR
jgi:hypothetical protein